MRFFRMIKTIAGIVFFSWLAVVSGCTKQNNSEHSSGQLQDQKQVVSPVFERSASFDSLSIIYDNSEKTKMLTILETLGGGVGLFDYDRDGYLDLLFPRGGLIKKSGVTGFPSRLVRQISRERFEDVSSSAGIAEAVYYSHGVACGDFDNDGFVDALVTGYGGLVLWHNNGDGTFSNEATLSKLNDKLWSTSAAWGDFNNDGYLDLYIAHYADWSVENNPPCQGPSGEPDVCGPRVFNGLHDTLYVNQADGTFQDNSQRAGITASLKGLGVLLVDFDQDRDIDIYVANDTQPNLFYVNDGQGNFEDQAMISGLALDDMANPNGSMGLTATDFNQDGLTDIFVTNYEDEMYGLYRNDGEQSFIFVSRRTGINQLGKLYVGFGCVAGDFDLDGDDDISIANGHVNYHPVNAEFRQKPLLLINEKESFKEATFSEAGYFSEPHLGRGMAVGDINRNGQLDLVFVNTLEPAALLFNKTASNSRSLILQLIGTVSNRAGVGAKVTLLSDKGSYTKDVCAGMSYLSSSPNEIYFAIQEQQSIQGITINWPSGKVSRISANELRFPVDEKSWFVQIEEPVEKQTGQQETNADVTILPLIE